MKKFFNIIQYILLFLLLYYLYKNNYFDLEFLNSFFYKKIFYIVFLFSFITIILNSYRWLIILKSHKFKISFFEIFKLVYISSFFNNILPGSYGGDLVRIFFISKIAKKNKLKISSSIFLDRIYGLFGLLFLGNFVFLIVSIRYDYFYFFIIFNCISIILIILIYIIIKRFTFLSNFAYKIKNFFELQFDVLLKCISISIVLFFFVHLSIYIISKYYFELDINLLIVFFSNTISTLSSVIPITPGGVGIAEFVYVRINQDLFNIYLSNLANVIIYFRLCNILTCLPSLFIFLGYKTKN